MTIQDERLTLRDVDKNRILIILNEVFSAILSHYSIWHRSYFVIEPLAVAIIVSSSVTVVQPVQFLCLISSLIRAHFLLLPFYIIWFVKSMDQDHSRMLFCT